MECLRGGYAVIKVFTVRNFGPHKSRCKKANGLLMLIAGVWDCVVTSDC